jgi:hypothetical protein
LGFSTNGSGPINGMFSKRGTFGGRCVQHLEHDIVSRHDFGRDDRGSGAASFAGSDLSWWLLGAAFPEAIWQRALPTSCSPTPPTSRRFATSARCSFTRGRQAAKFYWSTPLDGRTIDALDFATAEREPDQLLDLAALGDNLWLFGQSTVEAWAHTGEADLPFTRLENVAFDKGIMATGCRCSADNSLFRWLECSFTASEVPQRFRMTHRGTDSRLRNRKNCSRFARGPRVRRVPPRH